MSLKTERIKQPVIGATTQPLKLGGILEDGSDARLTIATDGSISTSTAVAVPSLTVNSKSVANSLLAEYTVTGSAVTSIDFSGLDINTHKSYRVEVDIVNATANNHALYMFVNNDTVVTNYYMQDISAYGSILASSRQNAPLVLSSGGYGTNSCELFVLKDVSNYPVAQTNCLKYHGSSLEKIVNSISKTATVTNITQLTFTSSVANAIGVGSKIRIYRGDV